MAETFDVVVLGGGTGGYSCALRAAGLGLSVGLVEKAKVGGTCLHWGCIPTKAFLHAAEVAEEAKHGPDLGVNTTFDGVDMAKVLSYKNGIVDQNWKGLQATMKSRGIVTFNGFGMLTGPNTITVTAEDGTTTDVEAAKAMVLATGSAPRHIPIAEVDGDLIITSDEAMTFDRVPERPIVLGASAVGVEFATVWNGYGSTEVTIIEAMDAVVPREDIDTQKVMKKELRKAGITTVLGEMVEKVEKGDGTVTVTTDKGTEITGDLLMVAIGRRPVTEDMGMESTGVTIDRGFITVDEYCRTGVTFGDGGVVYALGDVIPTLGLAHASFAEGMLVAEQVAGMAVTPIDYRGVPKVYYCTPEIGAVGYTEQELKEEGIAYEKKVFPFSHNARAMMQGGAGHVKILAEKEDDGRIGKVLGVHIVGISATDLIAEGQLIYSWEALPTDVAQFIHAHPSLSEAVGEAHLALAGRALHG